MKESRTILRHILATIYYRFSKSISGIHGDFFLFESGYDVRKPVEIIFHMSTVLSFFIAEVSGLERERFTNVEVKKEIERFITLLQKADKFLENSEVSLNHSLTLIQGPLADILTHIGQIAMIRRLSNSPIPAEDFMKAMIETGNFNY